MAEINYDFYDNKDIYDDGSVEEKLLDSYKNKKELNLYEDGVFYLTTDVRSNILNWYPFKKSDEVLEIGCGCGTLTGMLCDHCGEVCAVEGSKRRSEVTYYRHQDKDNLKIFVGNFDKIVLDKKFDYVVLIGVFEYAKMFFDVSEPFDYFLKKIKQLLKPTGKVLLAIENRYGIKYWAGCNEDHLYKPYIGLESYDGTKVQTFGKDEFIEILNKNQFVNYKFYYPFPDYKLPTIIYTDERLPRKDEISNLPIYLYGGKENFDIHKVLDGLLDNNLFGVFSNSFLVEFGLKDALLSDVSYARNLSYRNLDYKTITLESQKREIIKVADNEKAKCHLENLMNIHKKLKKNNIKVCNVEKKEEKYYMEYIHGKGVSEYILELTKEDKWEMVCKEIDKLVLFYQSISNYKKISRPLNKDFLKVYNGKTNVMKVSIVDGNASNIMIDENGGYVFIDQEWEANGDLPTEYLIYFSLVHIFGTNSKLALHFSLNDFLKKYHITNDKVKLFNAFDAYYFNDENCVVDVSKRKNLDACLVGSSDLHGALYSVVYYDVGDDFNEEHKIVKAYEKIEDNMYSVSFELPRNVKRVRFDPQIVGNKFIYFDKIMINGKKVDYEEYNISKVKDKSTLIQNYPFIVFPFSKEKLNIQVEFLEFSQEDIKEYLNGNADSHLNKDEKIQTLTSQNEELQKQLTDMQNRENARLINRVKNKISRKFRV